MHNQNKFKFKGFYHNNCGGKVFISKEPLDYDKFICSKCDGKDLNYWTITHYSNFSLWKKLIIKLKIQWKTKKCPK